MIRGTIDTIHRDKPLPPKPQGGKSAAFGITAQNDLFGTIGNAGHLKLAVSLVRPKPWNCVVPDVATHDRSGNCFSLIDRILNRLKRGESAASVWMRMHRTIARRIDAFRR